MRSRPTLIITACLTLCGLTFADTTHTPTYVRGIEIYGNVTTRPEILKHLIAFDTGEVLDTSKLRLTRANLLATQLYDKVDIFPHMREDGAHVFIILKESARLQLGYGGEYSTRKYGQKEIWYRFQFDAGIGNFGGRMEEFWFGASLWDYRSLDVSWYKPFLPSPYYVSASAGAAAYPSDMLPLDYTDVYARVAVGRKAGRRARVYVSATPTYRHRTIAGAFGEPGPESGPVQGPGAGVESLIPFLSERDFYEAFGAAGVAVDYRTSRFDPRGGWMYVSQVSTNRLYRGVNVPYFQLAGEFRRYWAFGADVASLRLLLTARDRDAGAYHRLTYGGAGEVRGYATDALGWDFVANSALLASLKYHKRLVTSPQAPFPLLGALFMGPRDLSLRVDAAFIADYALLKRGPADILLFRGPSQDGVGIGFGTRIMIPEIRQSGCIDLVFGRVDQPDGGFSWEPALHIYLDMFF